MLAAGCTDDPSVGTSSESHFLTACDSSCTGDLACICGVCTTTCFSDEGCEGFSPKAVCFEPEPGSCESDPGGGAPPGSGGFCDFECEKNSDCDDLGADYECQDNFCRYLGEPEGNDGGRAPADGGDGGSRQPCDQGCGASETCVDGYCEPYGCPEGRLACHERCVDPWTNGAHCGECDLACEPDQACQGGRCIAVNSPVPAGACTIWSRDLEPKGLADRPAYLDAKLLFPSETHLFAFEEDGWSIESAVNAGAGRLTELLTGDGWVLFANDPGDLYRYDGVFHSLGAPPVGVDALWSTDGDEIFIAGSDGSVRRHAAGEWIVLRQPGNPVLALSGSSGSLWIAESDRISHFDGVEWTPLDSPIADGWEWVGALPGDRTFAFGGGDFYEAVDNALEPVDGPCTNMSVESIRPAPASVAVEVYCGGDAGSDVDLDGGAGSGNGGNGGVYSIYRFDGDWTHLADLPDSITGWNWRPGSWTVTPSGLFIGTDRPLRHLTGDEWEPLPLPAPALPVEIALLDGGSDAQPVAAGARGVGRLVDGAWQRVPGSESLDIRHLYVAPDGTVLVTSWSDTGACADGPVPCGAALELWSHDGEEWTELFAMDATSDLADRGVMETYGTSADNVFFRLAVAGRGTDGDYGFAHWDGNELRRLDIHVACNALGGFAGHGFAAPNILVMICDEFRNEYVDGQMTPIDLGTVDTAVDTLRVLTMGRSEAQRALVYASGSPAVARIRDAESWAEKTSVDGTGDAFWADWPELLTLMPGSDAGRPPGFRKYDGASWTETIPDSTLLTDSHSGWSHDGTRAIARAKHDGNQALYLCEL
jgi:hypothetical protein